jgi:hypothetical protein
MMQTGQQRLEDKTSVEEFATVVQVERKLAIQEEQLCVQQRMLAIQEEQQENLVMSMNLDKMTPSMHDSSTSTS